MLRRMSMLAFSGILLLALAVMPGTIPNGFAAFEPPPGVDILRGPAIVLDKNVGLALIPGGPAFNETDATALVRLRGKCKGQAVDTGFVFSPSVASAITFDGITAENLEGTALSFNATTANGLTQCYGVTSPSQVTLVINTVINFDRTTLTLIQADGVVLRFVAGGN